MSANFVQHPVLYGFSLAYLFAPSTFSSANIIEFAASLPEWVKLAEKTILAAPFAFHSLNGLRHLAWDTGKCLSLHLYTWQVDTDHQKQSPFAQRRISYRLRSPWCLRHYYSGTRTAVDI